MRALLMKWKPVLLLVLLVSAWAMPMEALAQDVPPPTNVPEEVSTFLLAVLVAAVPLASWLGVLLANRLVPRLPSWTKPLLAAVLGYVQSLIPTVHIGGPWAWLIYPLLGLSATALLEVIKALRERGLTGSPASA